MENSWPNQEMNLCNPNFYVTLCQETAYEISAEKALVLPYTWKEKNKRQGEAFQMQQCSSAQNSP